MYRLISGIAAGFFIFIVWIIYLAGTGGESVFFDFIETIPYGDKLGHMCVFGFLTLVSIIGSKFRYFKYGRFKFYYGATFVMLFVIGEELSQAFIETRTFDLTDLVADAVGIVVAILIVFLARKRLKSAAI
ncbi:VanZ family protein [Marinomonas gallaica]|uniref:VanZ family protein n=1 Tax=Marinomonas gallaica TaxID=1806667 RepID=UPI003CE48461